MAKKKFKEPYHVNTWFERDRAHVALEDVSDQTIIEFWDEAYYEAVEDGFIDPENLEDSLREYAEDQGIL